MKIAVISSKERGKTDRLITATADYFLERGANLTGIVKVLEDSEGNRSCSCDMSVRVLPDGMIIPITQDLGEGSDACKLDPGAIARAVAEVESRPLDDVQLFIVNKFGPVESVGRGFCAAIGTALAADIPVLVGVGGPSRPAFDAFVDGLAEELPAEQDAIRNWCNSVMA